MGETARSWLVGPCKIKVPKRREHHGYAFTDSEMEADLWINDHRNKLVRLAEQCRDANALKEIAKILKYTP